MTEEHPPRQTNRITHLKFFQQKIAAANLISFSLKCVCSVLQSPILFSLNLILLRLFQKCSVSQKVEDHSRQSINCLLFKSVKFE